MTALLHRLLHDHPHRRRTRLPIQVQGRVPGRRPASTLDAVLAAAGERLVTRSELDALRSLHPRRVRAHQ